MTNPKFARGKTNKHKSTEKAHTISQVSTAVARLHGKPLNTPTTVRPNKVIGRGK